MNDNRPAWERKLDRDFVWKKVWVVLGILTLAGILLLIAYHVPVVTDYNRTFNGYELHYDGDEDKAGRNPAYVQEISVHLDGKLYRYLFQPDYFDGMISVGGFTTKQYNPPEALKDQVEYETAKIYFKRGEMDFSFFSNTGWGIQLERGTEEKIICAYANVDRGNEFFCFDIMMPHEDGGWTSSGNYVIAPADSPEEAADEFYTRVWSVWATETVE
ncbi:MAG: hypothetical protein J6N32_13490 [Clostridia bacterium]|nr:hypothetical protein [Clostridia bacterium]